MVKTSLILIRQSILLAVLAVSSTATHAIYWNVFNIEEETSFGAGFVTYNSVTDMLLDQNRVGVFSPDGLGSSENNIVGSGSDGTTYWNVFNIEEETSFGAGFVTYNSLLDMLLDQNRVGVFSPDGLGSSENNIVGSGSDGTTYWNVFNIEEETSFGAGFVTYNSLLDMLLDQNRAGVFSPDGLGSSENNIVGSGSDGTTYWNVFNIEEETSFGAGFVTYNSLLDMLLDQNRAGVFSPDGLGSSENNIVGSGAFVAGPSMVPEPSAILLFGVGIIIVFASQSLHRRQRRLV